MRIFKALIAKADGYFRLQGEGASGIIGGRRET
jgi:hypothetical protein